MGIGSCSRRVLSLRWWRRRRRCRLVGALLSAVFIAGVLYDGLILSRRSGNRFLPMGILGALCPLPAAAPANSSLLEPRRAELVAIAAHNRLLEQRHRDGLTAILFLHFHKAGGTSICATAGVNRERTAITAGGQTMLVDEPILNCNVCYRDSGGVVSTHRFEFPVGGTGCPYEDYSTSGSEQEQRVGFQRLVRDADGPRLSFIAIETPKRGLSPSFLSGLDRPWLYATAVRDPYDALLSDFHMSCLRTGLSWRQGHSRSPNRQNVCDLAEGSIFEYARIQAALPNRLVGGLLEGLTGIPRTIQRAVTLDSSNRYCWRGINGYTMKPCGAERLLQALHKPHRHTVASITNLTRTERLSLIVEEAKWRLERFSLVVVTDGGFGAGLAVARAKFGWDTVNECALRRGTRAHATMRASPEFQTNLEFREWLEDQFSPDLEVYEYAKAIAKWQFNSLLP